MATLGDKNQQNSAPKFSCISCDYNTSRKSNYETHLLSDKHKRVTNRLQMGLKSVKKQQEQANDLVMKNAVELVKKTIIKTVELKPEAIDEALIKKAAQEINNG